MRDKLSRKNSQVGGGEESGIAATAVDPEIRTRKRVIASLRQPGSIGRRLAPRSSSSSSRPLRLRSVLGLPKPARGIERAGVYNAAKKGTRCVYVACATLAESQLTHSRNFIFL